jgi:hypothetical protein
MPHQAVDKAEAWAESRGDTYTKKTKKGEVEIKRGYRADAPVMAGGVISWPREREAEWTDFRDASVRWLKNHYRERLLSVVEHLDERHPHLHFYCVPLPGEDFGAVHEGYSARQDSRNKGEKAGETITAYKQAMKLWQDDFYNAVAIDFGLARIGPARERKEREAALADRAKLELETKQHELAAAEEKLAETRETLNAGIKTLTKKVTTFKKAEQEFNIEKAAWQTPGTKIGTLLKSVKKAVSSDDEIEQLKKEKAELEKRTVQAVRAEKARWEPALKEARDDARYEKIKREEAEAARRAAEEKLARLERNMHPSTAPSYKSDYGPR